MRSSTRPVRIGNRVTPSRAIRPRAIIDPSSDKPHPNEPYKLIFDRPEPFDRPKSKRFIMDKPKLRRHKEVVAPQPRKAVRYDENDALAIAQRGPLMRIEDKTLQKLIEAGKQALTNEEKAAVVIEAIPRIQQAYEVQDYDSLSKIYKAFFSRLSADTDFKVLGVPDVIGKADYDKKPGIIALMVLIKGGLDHIDRPIVGLKGEAIQLDSAIGMIRRNKNPLFLNMENLTMQKTRQTPTPFSVDSGTDDEKSDDSIESLESN